MKDNRIMIDTSVWIEYFRGKNLDICIKVDQFLNHTSIFVPKIVIAELIQGAKSEKEIEVIKEFVDAFNIIDQTKDTWLEAGQLSFDLKKKGQNINLTDCYIALISKENNCLIFSLDIHFKRQEGSHIILRKDNPFCQLVVSNHKELDRGTLRAIIRQSGLSINEFLKLL